MHVPPGRPGDEADVESEGGTIHRKSKSQTPKSAKVTTKLEPFSPGEAPVEDHGDSGENDEDEDENGDEETFAVEKVLKHRIGKKQNVTRPCLISH